MVAKKKDEYVPLPTPDTAVSTTDTEPTAEALAAQRALLERAMDRDPDRVSLAPLSPEDALRALLATPSNGR